jgi:hypothetical protein
MNPFAQGLRPKWNMILAMYSLTVASSQKRLSPGFSSTISIGAKCFVHSAPSFFVQEKRI